MRIRRRGTRLLVVLMLMILPASLGAAPAWAASPVNGSGSTFAYVAIQQWMSDVARLQGLSVNFAPKGSTQGRQEFASRQADFASSDVSYNFPGGLGVEQDPPFKFTYMPLVAGGTAIMVNLKDNAGRPITDLQLSGGLLVKLFTQNMFSCANKGSEKEIFWDDQAIKDDNPGLEARLPHVRVRPVVRAGGSGTTAVFTDYLNQMDPGRWKAYMQGVGGNPNGCSTEKSSKCTDQVCGPTDVWPNRPDTDLVDGSDRVAIQVKNGNASWGWIGYAEYAYAIQLNVPVAKIKNAAGQYTLPTACNQAIALTAAERNGDGTYKLDNVHTHPHPSAYAISSYNYIIVPTEGFDAGKGETLAKFVLYSITDGQKNVDQIGYSPLPSNLIKQGFDVLGQVPGHPAVPGNPDTWGKFYENLQLPDGKKCGQVGEQTANDPPPAQNDNSGNNNQNNNNNQQNNDDNKKDDKGAGSPSPTPSASATTKAPGPKPSKTPKATTGPKASTGPKATTGPTADTGPQATAGPSASGSATPGETTSGGGDPGTTTPGATGGDATVAVDQNGQPMPETPGSTGNGLIDPTLAAGAAREIDTVASSIGTPWTLFGLAVTMLAIVFAPMILAGVRRLVRVGRPGE
ncbi:substrate-binding domain-containing protein [Sphaerisporangium sp. NBC_01403]|uniref:substrate-binding domain-containing protein n=1 Tax=Sphaerisporangium sp. NBC_01403 TaxID=2903599 RepID=UPI0032500F80